MQRAARQLAAISAGATLFTLLSATGAAAGWPGKPKQPPPRVSGAATKPPPAWVESTIRSWWLAYSTYCWGTTCLDFLPPETRPGLPVVTLKRRSPLRLHLAFRPRRLSIVIQAGTTRKAIRVPVASVTRFTPPRAGILVVSARGPGGSASYVAQLRLT